MSPSLASRIAAGRHWQALEQAAKEAALAGAMAAMGYYRGAWENPILHDGEGKNPSSLADLEATATILRTLHSRLAPLARKLGCSLWFFGEETAPHYWDALSEKLHLEAFACLRHAEEFFGAPRNALRVIIDGIDGTGSFLRGMPLFCSGAAVLVERQIRASAMYDPIHHVVYSALLAGPERSPESRASAESWHVGTGNRFRLADMEGNSAANGRKGLASEALGIHLTRTRKEKLHDFLGARSWKEKSMLERLADACGGVYALNSGILGMTEVARGALGGFVNIITNPWDVAAGEALVRACGGIVTDFEGRAIDYTGRRQISLVAAKRALHSDILGVLHG